MVSNIVNRLGDRPGLGVDVGGFSTVGRLGVLGFAFITSATVREGFERILPYQALLLPRTFSIATDAAREYVVADDTDIPAEVRPFIVERDLAGLFAVLAGANIPIAVDWVDTTLDEQRAQRLAQTWTLTTDVRPNRPANRIVAAPGPSISHCTPIRSEYNADFRAAMPGTIGRPFVSCRGRGSGPQPHPARPGQYSVDADDRR